MKLLKLDIKTKLIILLFASSIAICSGQQQLLNKYKDLYSTIHANNSFLYTEFDVWDINSGPSNSITQLGDGMSKLTASYLTLFQATNDKDMLIKFIEEALLIIENQ